MNKLVCSSSVVSLSREARPQHWSVLPRGKRLTKYLGLHFLWVSFLCGFLLPLSVQAQDLEEPPLQVAAAEESESQVKQQGQVWLAYMTQTRFTNLLSLWNDFHFVPDGFFVLRTGLTFHLPENINATAGYAYVGLPMGQLAPELKRPEHRPWMQVVHSHPLGEKWSLSQRVRYDARFRHRVEGGELSSGYGFSHRVRFLLSLKRNFPELAFGDEFLPFLTLSNEVLLNFGEDVVYNHLDQNRVSASLGLSRKALSLQVGYMNRYVQLANGHDKVMNHTLLLWVTHQIDVRKK